MEHAQMVEEKKQREEVKQAEMRENAKADLENVLKVREEKKTKRMAANRYARRTTASRHTPLPAATHRYASRATHRCARRYTPPPGAKRRCGRKTQLQCSAVEPLGASCTHPSRLFPPGTARCTDLRHRPTRASAHHPNRTCRVPRLHRAPVRRASRSRREEQTHMQMQRNASTAEDGQAVWAQVGLICDLKEKANPTTDTTRMRQLLVQLKHK
jgi:hypothetical protein